MNGEQEHEIVELRTRLQIAEAKLNTVTADLQHRIVVLEGQMENVRARLDGHDLGFATMGLDDTGKEKLAAMLHEADGTIGTGEEGTPTS